MPSILQVKGRWRAQVRRAGESTSRSFDTKREALEWATQVEAGLAGGKKVSSRITVAEVVEEYRRLRLEAGRAIEADSNQRYMLDHLAEDLGAETVEKLSPQRFVRWAQERKEQGAGAYTVNTELSALGTALRHVASFRGLDLPDVVARARPLLHHLQLIAGGKRRARQPEGDELERVLEHFAGRPEYQDIIQVLAVTGMRRGELVRLKWTDIDEQQRAVWIRQRKHPRRVEARDELVPLLGESWRIVQRQPREDERIFPIHPNTLTKAWTAACRALGVPDLHLHDLRREAASRLRERGFDLDERKRITGHRSDAIHERYIAVRLPDLHNKYEAATVKPTKRRRGKAAAARAKA
jgi:integrase